MNDIDRSESIELIFKLEINPAVVILGARQVGKTTLALLTARKLGRPYLYLDLENASDLTKLDVDPQGFLDYYNDQLIIIDEIQALPILFARLRSIIDKDRRNGRFMILGSASPQSVRGVSESLAGRISYLDLPPFKLLDLFPEFSMDRHWFRGGFPRSFLAESDDQSNDWLESFVRTYIERDLSYLFGYQLNPNLCQRLWKMLSHYHSGKFNAEELSRSLGISSPVVHRYVDLMVGAFLVYKIQPWFQNVGKRLVKSPKIYLKDSGILHYLNGIHSIEQLINHPIVGASWEGYVIEQIMYHKPKELDVYYYRTHNGTEIDLLLVKANAPICSIEIKYSNVPSISKGFYIGIDDLGTKNNFVITPSSDVYPVKNVMVCSLIYFLKNYLNELK